MQFLSYICQEVSRFCQIKRVNETNIRELDSKVAMEAYLREKKEAILKDRREEQSPDGAVNLDDDQKSHLQQV